VTDRSYINTGPAGDKTLHVWLSGFPFVLFGIGSRLAVPQSGCYLILWNNRWNPAGDAKMMQMNAEKQQSFSVYSVFTWVLLEIELYARQ
jgi:hypothetical protein